MSFLVLDSSRWGRERERNGCLKIAFYVMGLKSMCADNIVELFYNYDSFLLATGELVVSYYSKDKVHINMTGTRKLLENINKVHKICNMQRAHRQHTDHYNFRQRQTTFRGK